MIRAERPKTIVVIVSEDDGEPDDARGGKGYGVLLVRLPLVVWGAMVDARLRSGLESAKRVESNMMDCVKVVIHFLGGHALL